MGNYKTDNPEITIDEAIVTLKKLSMNLPDNPQNINLAQRWSDLVFSLRDVDHEYKKNILNKAWPFIDLLFSLNFFENPKIVKFIFEPTKMLYLYVPQDYRYSIVAFLIRWMIPLDDSHPMLKNDIIKNILKLHGGLSNRHCSKRDIVHQYLISCLENLSIEVWSEYVGSVGYFPFTLPIHKTHTRKVDWEKHAKSNWNKP